MADPDDIDDGLERDDSSFWRAFWRASRDAADYAALIAMRGGVEAALAWLPQIEPRLFEPASSIEPTTIRYLRENLEAARRHIENAIGPLHAMVGHKVGARLDPSKVRAAAFRAALLRLLDKAGFDAPARGRWLRVAEQGAETPDDLAISSSARRAAAEFVRAESDEFAQQRAELKKDVANEVRAEKKRLAELVRTVPKGARRAAQRAVDALVDNLRERRLGRS